MTSFNNKWSQIPQAEQNSFIKAINNINKNADIADMVEIETFLSSIGYPIVFGIPGHYSEYVTETQGNIEEAEEYIFSHD